MSLASERSRRTRRRPWLTSAPLFRRRRRSSASGLGWGDVFGAIASGVATLVDVVKTGANAVLTLAVKGAQYVFEAIASIPGRVLDLVQEFFRTAGVVFDRLFSWLGFLFDWSDILRTKEAVKHALTTVLDFAGAALTYVGTTVAGELDAFRVGVHDRFTAVQALLDPSTTAAAAVPVTFGGYQQRFDAQVQPHLAVVNDANAVNIVQHALVNHSDRVALIPTTPGQDARDTMTAGTDDLIAKLQALEATDRSDPAFVRVLDFLHSLMDRGLGFAAVGVSELLGLLDDLVQLALKGLKDLTTAIVGAVTSILGALAQTLAAEWKIPLISPLYAKIAHAPLTTIDLVSLAVAIPANTLSKLVYQRSPFPDDNALARFTGTFTVASLTQQLPRTTSTTAEALPLVAATEATDPPPGPSGVAITFGMIGLVNRGIFIFTDTWLDADPEAGDKAWLNTLALAQGWLSMVASCPWFDEAGSPGFGDADSLEHVAWIFQVVPNGVDSYFYGTRLASKQEPADRPQRRHRRRSRHPRARSRQSRTDHLDRRSPHGRQPGRGGRQRRQPRRGTLRLHSGLLQVGVADRPPHPARGQRHRPCRTVGGRRRLRGEHGRFDDRRAAEQGAGHTTARSRPRPPGPDRHLIRSGCGLAPECRSAGTGLGGGALEALAVFEPPLRHRRRAGCCCRPAHPPTRRSAPERDRRDRRDGSSRRSCGRE